MTVPRLQKLLKYYIKVHVLTIFHNFQILNSLADIGPPSRSDEYNVVNGLTQAVEELCKITDLQKKQMEENEDQTVENKGRVICLTNGRR